MKEAFRYTAIIVCALVALAIVVPFFQDRTPDAYVRANNDAIRMQPTATAAALVNQAMAVHDEIVVPAQAQAEANSILANSAQRIDEDAHQQALRHTGEMAALNISNTLRLNEIETVYTARNEDIKANGAKTVSEAQAEASRAAAGAWRDTLTYGGLAVGAIIVLVGGALAVVVWLSTRAKVINDPITGPMLVTSQGVILLGNVTTPAIAWNQNKMVTAGDSVMPLVAQRQAFTLIGRASQSDRPELARLAERSTVAAVQHYGSSPLLDSAVQALPSTDRSADGPLQPARVPTFAELVRNWRPTTERIIFGMIDGGPLFGRLDQLLSVIIVGRQEQGKTTLLRFIYAQCLMVGAEVQAWDIHEDIVEDLPGAAAYTSRAAIEGIAERTLVELDRRISAGEKRTARPLMILIDEINSLMDAVPIVAEVIKRIVTEGRKYRVYCVVSCKGAPASEFGKSYIRDAFSARYAFNTTTRQASMVGFDSQDVEPVRRLLPGQALFDGPVVPCIVRIPLITADDVKSLIPASGMVSKAPSTMVSDDFPMISHGFQMASPEGENSGETIDQKSVEAAEKTLSALALLKAGRSQSEVIAEVWGVTGGRAYQKASEELRQIIQESLK
ncbi:MAG: hypothetical protein ACOYBO_13285 [Azonexus sp.]